MNFISRVKKRYLNYRKRQILSIDNIKISTHLTDNEKIRLYLLSKGLRRKSVAVEIGSYYGASSVFIANGLRKSNGVLYCVDTWHNDSMSEGKMDTFDAFKSNTSHLRDFVVPLRGSSKTISTTFERKIDLIFFDGDHSYEGIKTDWESWVDKLNPGCVVIFHDIGWAEGVQKVIQEYVKPLISEESSLPNMYWAKLK